MVLWKYNGLLGFFIVLNYNTCVQPVIFSWIYYYGFIKNKLFHVMYKAYRR